MGLAATATRLMAPATNDPVDGTMPESASHHRPLPSGSNLTRWVGPLAVLAGGLAGSAGRYLVISLIPIDLGGFPVAILVVNLVGSLALGFYLVRRERAVEARWSLQFWAIGALGSFTTFSAFSVEVLQLIESNRSTMALGYVAASMVGGLTAAVLGARVGRVGR
jgi:CrcB protein